MQSNELIQSPEKCSSCGACVNACPVSAISLSKDSKGFLFPKIEESKCINCKKCISICPLKNAFLSNNRKDRVYAVVNKDKNLLRMSASGGAFSAIASWALDNDYFVYGCAWNPEMYPIHICVSNISDLPKLLGSKYVQSDAGSVFTEIKEKLFDGKKVLFSGTPCQCDGLRRFVGKTFDNLICIELVCHGVPSATLFHDYIELLEARLNGKIYDLKFRDKKRGWGALLRIDYINFRGKKRAAFLSPDESFYYSYYWDGYLYRDSCYQCKYAGPNRQSDLTIGDYWGIQKVHPEIDASLGVSVVLSSTEKGDMILRQTTDYLSIVPSEIEKAQIENGQLLESSQKSELNEVLLEIYEKDGIEGLRKYYVSNSKKKIIRGKIKRWIPLKVKRAIIKLISSN